MNGDWYAYGEQPAAFIASWKMMYNAIHSKTTRTYMNWSPNSFFGETLDSVHGGYTPYWPGQDYVDMVGISWYHYGGQERLNVLPEAGVALAKMKQFDYLYGSGQGLPLVLSETSAAYVSTIRSCFSHTHIPLLSDRHSSNRRARRGWRIRIRHKEGMDRPAAQLRGPA